jgi:hypothetical protein
MAVRLCLIRLFSAFCLAGVLAFSALVVGVASASAPGDDDSGWVVWRTGTVLEAEQAFDVFAADTMNVLVELDNVHQVPGIKITVNDEILENNRPSTGENAVFTSTRFDPKTIVIDVDGGGGNVQWHYKIRGHNINAIHTGADNKHDPVFAPHWADLKTSGQPIIPGAWTFNVFWNFLAGFLDPTEFFGQLLITMAALWVAAHFGHKILDLFQHLAGIVAGGARQYVADAWGEVHDRVRGQMGARHKELVKAAYEGEVERKRELDLYDLADDNNKRQAARFGLGPARK